MQCDRFREAISARIDGEDPGLPDGALDAHLEVCADCRAWRQRAHAVTRRARLGCSFLDYDLTRGWRRLTQRAALAAMAAAQLAITVPLLLIWQARTNGGSSAGRTADAFRAETGTGPVTPTVVMPRRDGAVLAHGSLRFPGSGKTAAIPVPDGPGDGGTPTGSGRVAIA